MAIEYDLLKPITPSVSSESLLQTALQNKKMNLEAQQMAMQNQQAANANVAGFALGAQQNQAAMDQNRMALEAARLQAVQAPMMPQQAPARIMAQGGGQDASTTNKSIDTRTTAWSQAIANNDIESARRIDPVKTQDYEFKKQDQAFQQQKIIQEQTEAQIKQQTASEKQAADEAYVEKDQNTGDAAKTSLISSSIDNLVKVKKSLYGNQRLKDGNVDDTVLYGAYGNIWGTGGKDYNTYYESLLQANLRALSGATLTTNDIKEATLAFKPEIGDSEEAVRTKIDGLQKWMVGALENQGRLKEATEAEFNFMDFDEAEVARNEMRSKLKMLESKEDKTSEDRKELNKLKELYKIADPIYKKKFDENEVYNARLKTGLSDTGKFETVIIGAGKESSNLVEGVKQAYAYWTGDDETYNDIKKKKTAESKYFEDVSEENPYGVEHGNYLALGEALPTLAVPGTAGLKAGKLVTSGLTKTAKLTKSTRIANVMEKPAIQSMILGSVLGGGSGVASGLIGATGEGETRLSNATQKGAIGARFGAGLGLLAPVAAKIYTKVSNRVKGGNTTPPSPTPGVYSAAKKDELKLRKTEYDAAEIGIKEELAKQDPNIVNKGIAELKRLKAQGVNTTLGRVMGNQRIMAFEDRQNRTFQTQDHYNLMADKNASTYDNQLEELGQVFNTKAVSPQGLGETLQARSAAIHKTMKEDLANDGKAIYHNLKHNPMEIENNALVRNTLKDPDVNKLYKDSKILNRAEYEEVMQQRKSIPEPSEVAGARNRIKQNAPWALDKKGNPNKEKIDNMLASNDPATKADAQALLEDFNNIHGWENNGQLWELVQLRRYAAQNLRMSKHGNNQQKLTKAKLAFDKIDKALNDIAPEFKEAQALYTKAISKVKEYEKTPFGSFHNLDPKSIGDTLQKLIKTDDVDEFAKLADALYKQDPNLHRDMMALWINKAIENSKLNATGEDQLVKIFTNKKLAGRILAATPKKNRKLITGLIRTAKLADVKGTSLRQLITSLPISNVANRNALSKITNFYADNQAIAISQMMSDPGKLQQIMAKLDKAGIDPQEKMSLLARALKGLSDPADRKAQMALGLGTVGAAAIGGLILGKTVF